MLAELSRNVSKRNAVSVCNVPSLAWVRLTEISKTRRITFKEGLEEQCLLMAAVYPAQGF